MLDKKIIKFLEEKLGTHLDSSSSCERLALNIGFTTLKRLLGFTSEKANPRQSTLEILARYLGFISYRELKDAINARGDFDFNPNAEEVGSSRLPVGVEINLSYYPNRQLKLKHVKNDKFIVMESINSSLQKGDTIFIDVFAPAITSALLESSEVEYKVIGYSRTVISIQGLFQF